MSGNLFMVATICLLIQLFSSHHPAVAPPQLWGPVSFRSHWHAQPSPPNACLAQRQVGRGWGTQAQPPITLERSSPRSLVGSAAASFPSVGPRPRSPARDLPVAHKKERQMVLNNKNTRLLHPNFHRPGLPVCLQCS